MNKSSSGLINRLASRTIFANIVEQNRAVKEGNQLRSIYARDSTYGALIMAKIGAVETKISDFERIKGGIPDPPMDLNIIIENGDVLIEFMPGSDGGSAITNYEYSIDGLTYNAFSPATTISPLRIDGLTNGIPYSIRLKAVNAFGSSVASFPVDATPALEGISPAVPNYTIVDGFTDIPFMEDGRAEKLVIDNYPYSVNGGIPSDVSESTSTILSMSMSTSIDDVSDVPSDVSDVPSDVSESTSTILPMSMLMSTSIEDVSDVPSDVSESTSTILPMSTFSEETSPGTSPDIQIQTGAIYTVPTINMGVSIIGISPFKEGKGNSYYFNSTSNYLSLPADDSWAFGTGDFTIEWFQYETDNNIFPRLFSIGSYPSTSISCSIEGGNFYGWFPDANLFSSVIPYKNIWIHFAIVRQSGILKLYKNGLQMGTSIPNTTNITNNTTTLYIGAEGGRNTGTWFGGYLTNMRIVKGLAVYTGNFTVPSSALTLTAAANPYGGSNTIAIPVGFTKLLLVPT